MAIGKHWPLAAALAVLYAALGGCLFVSIQHNDGHFVYALDDPYIHMAVAKNLTDHGVFGVTRHEFTASTSSIIWPLLLGLTYLLLGTSIAAPLLWNVLLATAVVWIVYALLRRQGFPPWLNLAALLMVAFCTPLPAIVFTGMEHTLHVLLAVAFLSLGARFLAEEEASKWAKMLYFALPPLITMTRYEGAFMVAVVCLLSALRGRIRRAVALASLGALPVILNGLVSLAHGWHFLPNSVLLKGRMPADSSFDQAVQWFRSTAIMLIQQPHIPALGIAVLLLLVAVYRKDRRRWTAAKAMIWVVLLTAILHLQFARTDWFFRYEAYLVACGLLAVFTVVHGEFAESCRFRVAWKPIVACVMAAVLAAPLMTRAARSLTLIPRVSSIIYQQQYQMAAFLKDYYPGQAIAANDIGAINFYADVDSLDLWGLANLEVADARISGRYGPAEIRDLSADRRVAIALVYTDWFERWHGGLPPEWQEVGQWEIAAARSSRPFVVSFYAVDPNERDALVANLRKYSRQLPDTVLQRGPYVESRRPSARVARRP